MNALPDDALDLLDAFQQRGVRFMLVGAHALAVHGVQRATGDVDFWVDATADNAQRVVDALRDFGAPLGAHGVGPEDFGRANTVYQMGLPPLRIDVLTALSGLSFGDAWANRVKVVVQDRSICAIGREDLIRNKLASGRTKDLADVEALRGA